MKLFVGDFYVDAYDEKIEKAQLKKDDYDLSPDEFKKKAENLFDALIIRSKVLELHDNCGKEAKNLYEPIKGVSVI